MLLTNGQKVIMQYIENYSGNLYTDPQPIGDSVIRVKEQNGTIKNLSCNVYCDIMDNDTKQISATSDLSHNLMTLGEKLPTKWTAV